MKRWTCPFSSPTARRCRLSLSLVGCTERRDARGVRNLAAVDRGSGFFELERRGRFPFRPAPHLDLHHTVSATRKGGEETQTVLSLEAVTKNELSAAHAQSQMMRACSFALPAET